MNSFFVVLENCDEKEIRYNSDNSREESDVEYHNRETGK